MSQLLQSVFISLKNSFVPLSDVPVERRRITRNFDVRHLQSVSLQIPIRLLSCVMFEVLRKAHRDSGAFQQVNFSFQNFVDLLVNRKKEASVK